MTAAGDFIEEYPGALDAETCASIIRAFEESGQAERGRVGGGVDTALKDSWDIDITERPEWAQVQAKIRAIAFAGLAMYVRKYRYTLLGPLTLTMKNPETGELRRLDAESLDRLSNRDYFGILERVFRFGGTNLQKYLADQGGYPYWHCEHYPRQSNPEPLARVLLYSVYLNDGFSAGETEFHYQQRRIAPRTGSLLIAPAFFTHTHRGNRPVGGDKYIATSWVLFR